MFLVGVFFIRMYEVLYMFGPASSAQITKAHPVPIIVRNESTQHARFC